MSLFLTSLLDDFNRANGALGSDWTIGPNATQALSIVSNQAHSTGSTRIASIYNVATFTQTEVWAVPVSITGTTTFNWILFARLQALTGSPDVYALSISGNIDRCGLIKGNLGGTWSLPIQQTVFFNQGNLAATDLVGFRVFDWEGGALPGTRLEAWTKRGAAAWVLEGAWMDMSSTRITSAGYAGMGGQYAGGTQGSALTFDDFSGGEFSRPSYPLADSPAFTGGKRDRLSEKGSAGYGPATPVVRGRRDRLTERAWSFRDRGIPQTVPSEQGGVAVF